MTVISTHLVVGEDGRISTASLVPPGEYSAMLRTMPETNPETTAEILEHWPIVDLGPWPEGRTFSREELYGDEER